MKWFNQWRNKTKNDGLLEVALAKLEFLTTEFLNDRDRKADVVHWREALKDAESYSNGSIAQHAIQAYQSLFILFAQNKSLSPDLDLSIEQLIVELQSENQKEIK
jgi:hypothetical protein